MLQSQVPHWEASASREHRGECMSSRRSFTQTVKHGPPYLNPMLTAQVQQFSVHYYLTAIEELSMVIGGPESVQFLFKAFYPGTEGKNLIGVREAHREAYRPLPYPVRQPGQGRDQRREIRPGRYPRSCHTCYTAAGTERRSQEQKTERKTA